MRLISTAACAAVAVALIAGCSGNVTQTTPPGPSMGNQSHSQSQVKPLKHHNEKPRWIFPANLLDNDGAAPPRFRQILHIVENGRKNTGTAAPKGIYVNQFYGSGVLAYQNKNTGNNPPFCSLPTGIGSDVNGIAADNAGNIITPVAVNYSGQKAVEIWSGPQSGSACGTMVASILDPYGQPSDAASFNSLTGTIAVSNIFDNSGAAGSISLCTVAGGCTVNLTNSTTMYKVAGVALATNGDCWASAENTSGIATLTYFAGCTGGGVQATGFMNVDYGGLSIDKNGNLVSVDKNPNGTSQLWVYSGCNPACTLVGGPFPLQGLSVFGAVNGQSMAFVAGDQTNAAADIYYYTPVSLTYYYSITNGISASGKIEGVAFNPPSKQ
ncbi:MAG: hypothetical protein JO146_00365 [Candidatus Eremiobacteraeota bacterium]|nr:hypothetical protein [Candidatus Eremiobacteraeota bacterium]